MFYLYLSYYTSHGFDDVTPLLSFIFIFFINIEVQLLEVEVSK